MSVSNQKKPFHFRSLFSRHGRGKEEAESRIDTLTHVVSAPLQHRESTTPVPPQASSPQPNRQQQSNGLQHAVSTSALRSDDEHHDEPQVIPVEDAAEGSHKGEATPTAATTVQPDIEHPVPEGTTISLWDRAYDTLKAKEDPKMQKLMAQYETMLEGEMVKVKINAAQDDEKAKITQAGGIFDPDLRRAQLEALQAEKMAAHAAEGKIVINGHIIDIRQYMKGLATTVNFAKDWISKAAEASPYASVAWSVVCLGLPLLMRPAEAEAANMDGLRYVSSRMQYYIALESLLFADLDGPMTVSTSRAAASWDELRGRVINLYQAILEYQIRTIIRMNKTSWYKDVYQADNWLAMRTSIVSLEASIEKDSSSISSNETRAQLKQLVEEAAKGHDQMVQAVQSINDTLKQQEMDRKRREEKEKYDKCLQALVLDVHYQDGKNNVPVPVPGTCKWFLSQPSYLEWLNAPGGSLLVSADPGCGKSVLAKEILEHDLQRHGISGIYCYFFFKDQTQNTVLMALAAILHQILSQQRDMIKHLLSEYETHGKKVASNYTALSGVLDNVLQDPDMVHVTFVIDALDECEEDDRQKCFDWFEQLSSSYDGRSKAHKIIATSRAYIEIVGPFEDLANSSHIHVGGSDSNTEISDEVNLVIQYRCNELLEKKQITRRVRDRLQVYLLEQDQNTYLYVHLIFEELSKADLRKQTPVEFDIWKDTLPTSVDSAYEKILSRNATQSNAFKKVTRVLNAMLAADRPLTVREIECVFKVDPNNPPADLEELDLEDDVNEFQSNLRDICGGFIQIHDEKVTFIHQTAREFLLPPNKDKIHGGNNRETIPSVWHHAFALEAAHAILASVCIQYLSLKEFETNLKPLGESEEDDSSIEGDDQASRELASFSDDVIEALSIQYPLLSYAASQWASHFTKGRCSESKDRILSAALDLYSIDSAKLTNWARMSGRHFEYYLQWLPEHPRRSIPLLVVAATDSPAIFKLMLEKVDLASEKELGKAALNVAIRMRRPEYALLLLQHGVDPNTRDNFQNTILSLSVEYNLKAVTEYILTKDVDVNSANQDGWTVLHFTVTNDPDGTQTALLVRHGADHRVRAHCNGKTVFHAAVEAGALEAIKNLPLTEADLNERLPDGRTALIFATEQDNLDLMNLLLSLGTNPVDAQDNDGTNALVHAIWNDNCEALKILLDHKADATLKDPTGCTPLWRAAADGYHEIIRLLLDYPADINGRTDDIGLTPLAVAALNGRSEAVEVLLQHNADPSIEDSNGATALSLATAYGRDDVLEVFERYGL